MAECELVFERLIVSNLIGVYAPTVLIVLMSWTSFYMSVDAVGARTNLCVTSFLALGTQFSSIRKELPTVSYINVSTRTTFVLSGLMCLPTRSNL